MSKQCIYETKGRAREFNELAINLFTGCGHKCLYCYGANVTHQTKEAFENNPQPRITLEDIEQSANKWTGEKRRILLCFITDPYQPIEQETQLTRHIIEILHRHRLNVVILTKGGLRSMRDFDLLTPQDAYATTLTLINDEDSKKWEPNAGLPQERINALKEAHKLGIETWVSFEPVICPEQTYKLLTMTKDFVGHFKIGKLNYCSNSINWQEFGWRMKSIMDIQKINYYFKIDLLKEMGIDPIKFKQTWICR